jgi:Na+-driven multidrug efflux pump
MHWPSPVACPARRPLNSVLVAQRITRPQTLVALLMVPAHVVNNYVLIFVLGVSES